MAEKRLDIKVAATATGVEDAKRQLQELDKAARNASKAGGGPGAPSSLSQRLRSLNRQAQDVGLAGDSSFVGLAKGAGAAIALNELGQSLQRVNANFGHYQELLRTGGAKTELFASVVSDAIPVVGNLAKGFRSLWDTISDLISGRDRELEQQIKEDRQAGAKAKQARDARRAASLFENTEEARRALGETRGSFFTTELARQRKQQAEELSRALGGVRGGAASPEGQDLIEKSGIRQAFDQAVAQANALRASAQAAFDEKKLKLDRERDEVRGNLAPDQIPGFDRDMANRRRAAEFKRDEALAQADAAVAEAQTQRQREEEAQAKASRDRRNAREDKQREFDRRMLGLSEQLLGDMGAQGKLEAERVGVKKRIKELEQELIDQMRDPNLADDQKRQAGQLREMLPALERDLLFNVARENQPPNRTQLQNSRFLTGAGNPIESTFRRAEKHTDEIRRTLNKIFDFISRHGGGDVIPNPF